MRKSTIIKKLPKSFDKLKKELQDTYLSNPNHISSKEEDEFYEDIKNGFIDVNYKKIEYDNFDIITKYVSEYKLVSTEESSNDEVSKISKVSSSLENYYLNISGAFNETTEISEFTIYIPDELVLSTIYSSSSSKEIYMQIVAAIVTILRFYFGCIKFVMDFVNNNLSLFLVYFY